MKIAYSYQRHSTSRQKDGHSRARQKDSAKAWCAQNGYVLSETEFYDEKSAYKGDNFKEDGALRHFINLHKEGKIHLDSVLIIDSIDRFSRLPTARAVKHFLDIVYAGIKLAFSGSYLCKEIITPEVLEKPENDGLLTEVVAELKRAHRESAEKSRKVKAALDDKRAKMKSGLVLSHNNVPKHFKFIPKEKEGKSWRGEYVQHPTFAPYVKELVQGFLAGKSLYELALDFNNRNIPTFKCGREWHRNSVRRLLDSRTLIGEYLGTPNYVESLIDEQTFLKLQDRLNQNGKNRGKKSKLVNVFKGVAFCAECGYSMQSHSKEHKGIITYRYLRCSNYGRRTSCSKAYLHLEPIERDFFFNFLSKDPYKLINGDDVQEVRQIKNDITAKTVRQIEIGKALAGLAKVIELSGSDSPQEFTERTIQLQKERTQLKEEIDSLNAKAATIQGTPEELKEWMLKITRFGEGQDGEDLVIYRYEDTVNKIKEALRDNAAREKLRVLLPSMIGKILISSKERKFIVLNRMGKLVYQSPKFPSQNNNTERWRKSLKEWTERKTAGGRVITCKRYQGKPRKQERAEKV